MTSSVTIERSIANRKQQILYSKYIQKHMIKYRTYQKSHTRWSTSGLMPLDSAASTNISAPRVIISISISPDIFLTHLKNSTDTLTASHVLQAFQIQKSNSTTDSGAKLLQNFTDCVFCALHI